LDNSGTPPYSFVKELVHIPKKTLQVVKLTMDQAEQNFYNRLKTTAKLDGDVPIPNALAFLTRLRQAAIHPWLLKTREEFNARIKSVANNPSQWRSSSKINYVVQDVRDTKPGGERDDEKSLIFSQFTRALDLLEIALQRDGWVSETRYQKNKERYANYPRYVRIDGKTTYEQRESAMKKLRDDPNVKLALLSLHATGVGLTLTSANNVYFLDLFFNPQVHAQAIDRAHRIGQDKVVKVKMVVIKDTVEDELLKLLDYKDAIFETTLKPVVIGKDRILKLLK